MSPFTFEGIGSANPAIYAEFCDFIKVDKAEIENRVAYCRVSTDKEDQLNRFRGGLATKEKYLHHE